MLKNKKGIGLIPLILIIVLVLVVGAVAIVLVLNKDNDNDIDDKKETKISSNKSQSNSNKEQKNEKLDNNEISVKSLLQHSASPESDFFCSEDGNGGMVLQQYLGNDEIVVIPETYGGLPIVSTISFTFANNKPVKALKYPNNLKEIAKGNSGLNENLEIVVVGSGTEIIRSAAFQGCKNLKEVSLNNGLKTIENHAFALCDNLKSLSIPESVTEIQPGAFYGHPQDFVIYGKAGSVAETYAKENNITFIAE